ncbi:MAG: hypothetical protein ABIJ18_04340 [archaeon]
MSRSYPILNDFLTSFSLSHGPNHEILKLAGIVGMIYGLSGDYNPWYMVGGVALYTLGGLGSLNKVRALEERIHQLEKDNSQE